MATIRILQADVRAQLALAMMGVKHAVEDARAQGLIVELPEKMDFQVTVVTAAQSLVSEDTHQVTDTDTMDRTVTRIEGTATNVRTESAATNVRTEGAATNTRTEDAVTNVRTEGTQNNVRDEGPQNNLRTEGAATNTTNETTSSTDQLGAGGSTTNSNTTQNTDQKTQDSGGDTVDTVYSYDS